MSLSRPDAVVIGAGPYGLAVASHLSESGVACRVFGSTMAGWVDNMPRGMFLKSTSIDSSIGTPRPGFGIGDFCQHDGITPYDDGGGERPIPVDEFVRYGRWFAQHLVPHLEDTLVRSVEHGSDGYRVELETGERLVTANVVVSVGPAPFAYVPEELADLTGAGGAPDAGAGDGLPPVSHSSDHPDLSVFAGRRVAVVGAGQSALESAVLLREAGAAVHLVVRNPPVLWAGPPSPGPSSVWGRMRRPAAPLGSGWTHLILTRYAGSYHLLPESLRMRFLRSILGPAGAWWLHPRFTPDIDIRLGYRVASATMGGYGVDLVLYSPEQGSGILHVDHVIAATGYQVDLGRLGFLRPGLVASVDTTGPFPRLSPSFESSAAGLFFAGLTAAGTFGPMLRFVAGTDFAARRICAGVTTRVRSRVTDGGRDSSLTDQESAA